MHTALKRVKDSVVKYTFLYQEPEIIFRAIVVVCISNLFVLSHIISRFAFYLL